MGPAPAPAEPEVVVHADGASRGNPGPAAAGVVLTRGAATLRALGRPLGPMTSNRAEYEAVLLGLALARDLGARRVALRVDSELVARQLGGRYAVRHPGLKPLHRRALDLLGGFAAWRVEHVPRARNARADALANRALDEGREVGGP